MMCNVMDEKMATGLRSRLERLYMTKNLSNKLYLKKQLYVMHEQRDNGFGAFKLFQQGHRELLAIDVKIDKKNKALMLLS